MTMSIQAFLTAPPNSVAMGADGTDTNKKPRVSEAYSFYEFPLKKLVLKKPECVTKSVFSVPDLQESLRMPFINLTPTPGE